MISLHLGTFICALILSTLIHTCVSESTSESWLPERLGVSFEFKIHIDAGKEECFFQEVHAQTTLYVAFQVIRGGDGKAGFGVRNPQGHVLLPYDWKETAEYEDNLVTTPGYYQFCIDNSLSRFAFKVVSLYVSAYKRDEWEKYVEELTESDGRLSNVTTLLQNVDHNIGTMLRHVDHSRRVKQHDYLVLDANHSYIQNFSLLQCVVIIACSLAQIYFVRKFFGDSDEKPMAGSTGYRPTA